MKRLCVFLAIAGCFVFCAACSDVPQSGAVIMGDLSGFAPDDSITVYLVHYDGPAGRSILTDTLRDGHFYFRLDSLSGEKRYALSLMRIHKDIGAYDMLGHGPDLYLEPGALVRIKGEGKYLPIAKVSSPVKDQKLRQRFISKMSQEDWKRSQDLFIEYYALLNDYSYGSDTTRTYKESLKRKMTENMAATDSVGMLLTEQKLEIMETEPFGEYALTELSSIASFVSSGYKDFPKYRETVTRLANRLTEEQKQTRQGKEILSYLRKVTKVSVGDAVPAYEYVDADGGKHYLSELRGKWLLLDFWSLGCGPCIESAKELRQLSDEIGDKNLQLVSISVDGEEGWKEASELHQITWTNWRDPMGQSGSIRAYNQNGFPVFVLVDPDGIIKDIHLGHYDGLLHKLTDDIKAAHPLT
jgi:peroxiredoxin